MHSMERMRGKRTSAQVWLAMNGRRVVIAAIGALILAALLFRLAS